MKSPIKYWAALCCATLITTISLYNCSSVKSDQTASSKMKLKALIIDGENNHGTWPKTTAMMKSYLEDSGLFSVDIERTTYIWQGPHADEILGPEGRNALLDQYPIVSKKAYQRVEEPKADPSFNPQFENYDLVISNLGWKASTWSDATKRSFESYMNNGGGLIVIHAANNSFADWPEYNKMIGVGGWGGRDVKSGPYAFYNDEGKEMRDHSEGDCGSHGPRYEFTLTTRASNHPIMKGLPKEWLHTEDELYDRLRGPAENMTILATAYSDVEKNSPPWAKDVKGTGRHEPMLMALEYGKGRVFHSGLGHNDYSMECVGFQTTLLRGAEWAATGKVTQAIPANFPTKTKTSSVAWSM